MNEHRANLVFGLVNVVNFGSCNAFNNSVYGLEVRRIRGEGEANFFTTFKFDMRSKTLVVFDVTIKSCFKVKFFTFKFREDIAWAFFKDICQCVEAAAVCHPHHEIFYAKLGAFVDQSIKCWNQALSSFNGETFLTYKFLSEKPFKTSCLIEFFIDFNFAFWIENRAVTQFNFVAKPINSFGVAHVHVFDSDRLAVGQF